MIHIVNVSGGAGSAVCLLRVVDRYGTEGVRAVFADTLIEDPTLYRFLDDLERVSGVQIERLSQGVSAWDVFTREAMWTNPQTGGCLASHHLKKLPLRKYRDEVAGSPESAILYVGYDISEQDRMARFKDANEPWRVEFPLAWPKPLVRCDQLDFLRNRGLVPCDMYERGYSHANCGGTCVLAGIKQWAMVRKDYPERFAHAVAVENQVTEFQAQRGRGEYTILARRRKGKSSNLPLSVLASEFDSGEVSGDDGRVSSCSCVGMLFDVGGE